MRAITNWHRLLVVAIVIGAFTYAEARAETPLIEILKANPEWFGTVGGTNSLAVTFHIKGDPPKLENVSYRWEGEELRDSVEFKVGERNIEFLIPPRDRNRWYKLDLTNDGALIGTLTGLERDTELTFQQMALLRPVKRPAGPPVELKGSAKYCSVPPDFVISNGKDLPPELKRFLGYFSGNWGGDGLYHTLLVADVNKHGTAVAYYAYDAHAEWRIYSPACYRNMGKIKDGVLTLTLGNGAIVTYVFSDADRLQATYNGRNLTNSGQFTRHD